MKKIVKLGSIVNPDLLVLSYCACAVFLLTSVPAHASGMEPGVRNSYKVPAFFRKDYRLSEKSIDSYYDHRYGAGQWRRYEGGTIEFERKPDTAEPPMYIQISSTRGPFESGTRFEVIIDHYGYGTSRLSPETYHYRRSTQLQDEMALLRAGISTVDLRAHRDAAYYSMLAVAVRPPGETVLIKEFTDIDTRYLHGTYHFDPYSQEERERVRNSIKTYRERRAREQYSDLGGSENAEEKRRRNANRKQFRDKLEQRARTERSEALRRMKETGNAEYTIKTKISASAGARGKNAMSFGVFHPAWKISSLTNLYPISFYRKLESLLISKVVVSLDGVPVMELRPYSIHPATGGVRGIPGLRSGQTVSVEVENRAGYRQVFRQNIAFKPASNTVLVQDRIDNRQVLEAAVQVARSLGLPDPTKRDIEAGEILFGAYGTDATQLNARVRIWDPWTIHVYVNRVSADSTTATEQMAEAFARNLQGMLTK